MLDSGRCHNIKTVGEYMGIVSSRYVCLLLPCILREAHAFSLLSVCNGAVLLDYLIYGYFVEILQVQTRFARLYDIADNVMHVAEEKEAGGAAAKVQITESVHIAGASIIKEVDEVIVIVEPEYHIIAPWRHHKDTFRTAKSGAQ